MTMTFLLSICKGTAYNFNCWDVAYFVMFKVGVGYCGRARLSHEPAPHTPH